MNHTFKIAVLTLSVLPLFAYAENPTSADIENIEKEIAARTAPIAALPAGTVNCFNYYRFGSIEAQITASTLNAVSGTPITFSATLKNTNPYPVVDGTLVVKIFRLNKNATEKNPNGPHLVAEFTAKDGIVLAAGSSTPISFQWMIPAYALSGEYEAATFFTTEHKFNLLGLTFTNDVIGNTARFKVSGEVPGIVSFDKEQVTIDGNPYYFAAYPPRVSATAPVTIADIVRNDTDAPVTVPIQWQIYQWDAQRQENLIHEESTNVQVPAHGTAPVSITLTDTAFPVYLLKGTLTWKDTTSIIEPRFVREGKDRLRINFPSITSFPLKAGVPTTLFSCLHNAGSSEIVDNGKLELTLSDAHGRVIHTYTYQGGVTGAMMGVADAFTPRRDIDHATLDAKLYQGDTLVDEAQVSYDCTQIDPAQCNQHFSGLSAKLFLLLAVLMVAAFLVLQYRNHMSRKNEERAIN